MLNTNEKFESYVDYCKDFTIKQLEDYTDTEVYGCDLPIKLTEGINVDGSATYSTNKAKQYIKEWWNEAGEYYDFCKQEFGEVFHNPFEEPEAYHVCMIIEGVRVILNQCPTFEKYYDEEFELTEEIVNKLIEEVKQVKEIEF